MALAANGCADGAESPPPSTDSPGASATAPESFDEARWSRSSELNELSAGGPLGLAGNDVAAVALMDDGAAPGAYRTTDGLAWEPIDDFPTMDLHGCPPAIAGGSMGFVVVGTRLGDSGAENADIPVVAYSADGLGWQEVPPAALPTSEVAWMTDAFPVSDGVVVFGADGSSAEPFVWFSRDARSWIDSDLVGDAIAVTASGDGWAALTVDHSADADDQPGVWTSSDGLTWSRVETRRLPATEAVYSYCGNPPFAADDDAWVLALRERPGNGYARDVTSWATTDGGATWEQHLVVDVPERGDYRVHELAAIGSGFVLTGWWDVRPGGEHHAFAAYSEDGATWAVTPVSQELTDVTALGSSLVLVDDDGNSYVWHTQHP